MTLRILIIAGILFGAYNMSQDPRAHMDGGNVRTDIDRGFAGITYIHERPNNKRDLTCWSGLFYDYEAEVPYMSFGTECHLR